MRNISFLVLLFSAALLSQVQVHKQIRLQQPDEKTIITIQQLGIDLEGMSFRKDEPEELIVSSAECVKLDRAGIAYTVLIPDMQKYYETLPKLSDAEKQAVQRESKEKYGVEGFGFGSMGGYYTYAEITANLDSMFAQYPNLVTQKAMIGASTLDKPIWMVKISDNPNTNENEPHVFFDGLIHAREPQSMACVMYYMWYLLENYNTNPEVKYLVDNREIYFVPCMNPDGYEYNRQTNPGGGGMWRLNRRNNGNGTYGVDLNRNFGYKWGYDNSGSSGTPGDETYRGPSAFSEPEPQAIRNFLNTKNVKTYINYHSYNNSIIYPWGYIQQLTPDSSTYIEYASYMSQFNGYDYGNSYQTLGYTSNGTARDWGYGDTTTKGKIYSYVFEVGGSSDGFWPAQSRIFPLAQGNLRPNLFQAWIAGGYVSKESVSYTRQYFLPNDTIGMKVKVKNRGLSSAYNVNVTLASLDPKLTVLSGAVVLDSVKARSSAELTTPLKFILAPDVQASALLKMVVTTSLGAVVMSRDTVKISVGMPSYLFRDTTDNPVLNWTITATPATPKWEATTATFVSAPASFTDSKTGSYANSATVTMASTNPINLTGYASAKLKFSAKWDIEKKWDCGVVQVSTNNGSTWTSLAGRYTVPASGSGKQTPAGMPCYDGAQLAWIDEEIDLAAYANQNIKLRFELRTDGSQQKDGWYLDDISIVVYALPTTTWATTVTVKNAGGIDQREVVFGTGPTATDGIDLNLGEIALPPIPPVNILDARFELPIVPVESSFKDFRNDSLKNIAWRLRFQPGAEGYPMTFSWNPSSLPSGSFTLQDIFTGALVNVDMKAQNQFVLTNSALSILKIEFKKQSCKDIALNAGWNMVAVPLAAADMNAASIFPLATSPVFAYNNGYVNAAALANGKGYWVRYPNSGTAPVCGNPVPSVTVDVVSGWNMIGVYDKDIASANITTTPAGILSSVFFGFSNGYTQANTLQPGKGYWVRAAQNGTINLPAGPQKAGAQGIAAPSNEWGRIRIADAAGAQGTLYIAGDNGGAYDLPPVPPAGIFDVRFASDKFVGSGPSQIIKMQSALYPVTLEAVNVKILIGDAATGGKVFTATLENGKRLQLTQNYGDLYIESSIQPLEFALYQNYPNPFNPVTRIKYSTSSPTLLLSKEKGVGNPSRSQGEGQRVRLSVYDILGREVATLVNEMQQPGLHEVEWNASAVPSGVYYYELQAGEFRSVKKAVLMK